MSDLTGSDRRRLEKLLGMGNGYVLNFSDRTFSDFFAEYSVDIDAERFKVGGTSKANRMRAFWALSENSLAGTVINGMIIYATDEQCFGDSNPLLIDECKRIAQKLLTDQPVTELGALSASVDEKDFEVVANHIRVAIENNQPEGALDRLHTYTFKYVRTICTPRGIITNRDKPLHSIFGEYVKALRAGGHLKSVMTERILKNSIAILDAFNDVRNNQSLAHDNQMLNYEESLLIFNQVAATIRFIKAIELQIKTPDSTNNN
ncbi:MAG: abortive infection family protein [Humidesulfovibrio sp.]